MEFEAVYKQAFSGVTTAMETPDTYEDGQFKFQTREERYNRAISAVVDSLIPLDDRERDLTLHYLAGRTSA